jgi:hypothetical protein
MGVAGMPLTPLLLHALAIDAIKSSANPVENPVD